MLQILGEFTFLPRILVTLSLPPLSQINSSSFLLILSYESSLGFSNPGNFFFFFFLAAPQGAGS